MIFPEGVVGSGAQPGRDPPLLQPSAMMRFCGCVLNIDTAPPSIQQRIHDELEPAAVWLFFCGRAGPGKQSRSQTAVIADRAVRKFGAGIAWVCKTNGPYHRRYLAVTLPTLRQAREYAPVGDPGGFHHDVGGVDSAAKHHVLTSARSLAILCFEGVRADI